MHKQSILTVTNEFCRRDSFTNAVRSSYRINTIIFNPNILHNQSAKTHKNIFCFVRTLDFLIKVYYLRIHFFFNISNYIAIINVTAVCITFGPDNFGLWICMNIHLYKMLNMQMIQINWTKPLKKLILF